ncbi:MAG: winged helix-turn-helix transcriptional regulator [Methylococcales bacterium]|jgi:DNA-binding transcriptional ArsR family regulator|nr:winged helix-turn-helix transcriptional regulator [Methylococcales bacterium]MBT7445493.1 winged helix-turn-helix transcriptional regulator [Methylococcales bacterium]
MDEQNQPQENPTDDDAALTANALKAMAHPIRWKILCVLGNAELNVREIMDQVGSTQSNVSQHIEVLRSKNILISRKDGNKVYCRIANPSLQNLIDKMRGVLCSANLDEKF